MLCKLNDDDDDEDMVPLTLQLHHIRDTTTAIAVDSANGTHTASEAALKFLLQFNIRDPLASLMVSVAPRTSTR